jgi:hypothetical protein
MANGMLNKTKSSLQNINLEYGQDIWKDNNLNLMEFVFIELLGDINLLIVFWTSVSFSLIFYHIFINQNDIKFQHLKITLSRSFK